MRLALRRRAAIRLKAWRVSFLQGVEASWASGTEKAGSKTGTGVPSERKTEKIGRKTEKIGSKIEVAGRRIERAGLKKERASSKTAAGAPSDRKTVSKGLAHKGPGMTIQMPAAKMYRLMQTAPSSITWRTHRCSNRPPFAEDVLDTCLCYCMCLATPWLEERRGNLNL